ncbi:endothelin-converting enzyme homolog isoform X2 [Tigriopus californicus]|uniref:endothelin-converting enzyme homolog isoform X2 n=1 Tax=Tigriopus californicus TaxID=6832 RepID=UPI0027DA4E6E|nr:endothelin-converting enzyme homolog isoform X2 [Tigriopus californicus]
MSSTCQHNLYICHCTPSSNDPSPIHPNSSRGTRYSLASLGASSSSNGVITSCSTIAPLYLTSAAVTTMTSPSLRNHYQREKSTSLSSLSPDRNVLAHDVGYNTIPRVIVNANGHVRMTSNLGASSIILSGTGEQIRFSPSVSEKYIKYQKFWPVADSSNTDGTSRGCLERIVFVLLTMVLVIIFLVAALVFLYLGSNGTDSYSIVFSGDPTGQSEVVSDASNKNGFGRVQEETNSAGGFSIKTENYGIDVVRVRNHEGKPLPGETSPNSKRVCISQECSKISRNILQNINPEKDPCASFYNFACGGWMTKNQPPPRRMAHSVMSQARDHVDVSLRDLIEQIIPESSDTVDSKLRTFYDSCMDVDSIRSKGSVPALDFLHQKFGKFIVNHDISLNKAVWKQAEGHGSETNRRYLTELVLNLLKVNGTPLLDISLDLAPRNSSSYISVVRVPQRSGLLPRLVRSRKEMALFNRWMRKRKKRNSRMRRSARSARADFAALPLEHKVVQRQEIFKSFQNALNAQRTNSLIKTAEAMGLLDQSSEDAKQSEIAEILGFLTALEKVIPTEKELKKSLLKNAIYNEYTVRELEISFKFINWKMLLSGLFPHDPSSHDLVIVHDPTYIRKIGRIISLFDPRVIWKSLLTLYSKDVLSDIITVHHGQARWQYCTQVTSMVFGEALSRLFLQSVAADKEREILLKEIQSLFDLIRSHVLNAINGTSWLHSHMKELAMMKISKLEGQFVGSEMYLNETFLHSRYDKLDMSSDYFSNVIGMFKHFRKNIYNFLQEPVDRETYTWNLISFPFTVNAFHLQQLNSIVIPLGLLQESHFTRNVPQYLNLASLGLTMAHEILHALDNTGRDFNSGGSLHHWWDPKAQRAFQNISKCFIEQYEQHFRRPIKIDARSILLEVDGKFTLNENICDVDGIRVVSNALLSLPFSPEDLIYLPNNPYSPQQLFFIKAAQSYCSHLGPVSYVLYLELDEHSPNPERVDGFLMNSPLFSQVFQCQVGSRMNPQNKCSIWS